ncbi:MAG: tetratricopeptide repeat protein [Deltaproteobacteria bacterium]|jgi:tetratricopeptide (TPR) repeat protein|nr:tetratricopeptide repeat protein [Deltaproteobacteria bacterium]
MKLFLGGLNILDNYYHTSQGEVGTARRIFRFGLKLLFLLVFIAGSIAVVWNFTAPESLARSYGRFFGPPLTIHGLQLQYGNQTLSLKPGVEQEINPSLPLRISSLDTNRWRNYDLRLHSPDLDVQLLINQANSPLDILGEDFFQDPKILVFEVKEGALSLARFSLKAAFTALDWANRADAAVEAQQKISYYRKALSLEPGSEALTKKLADALADSGRNDELSQLLEKELLAIEDASASLEILGKLLRLYRELKDLDDEIRTLERIIVRLEKTAQPIRPYKVDLAALYKTKDPMKAAQLYEELLDELENDVENDTENAIKDESKLDYKRAYLGELVSIYRQSGQLAQQIGAWERVLKLATPQEVSGIWTELVSLHGQNSDMPGQLKAWEGLATSLPDGVQKGEAYKRLAYLLYEQEQFTEAYEAYLSASMYDQSDPSLFLNMARLALKNGNQEAYRENLEKSLALDDAPALKKELALAYNQEGLADKALPLWKALAELSGEDLETRGMRKEAIAQLLNALRPTDDKFSEEFEESLYQFSDNSVEFYNLAVSYFKVKQWDNAQKAFLKALELDKGQNVLSTDVRGYLMAMYKEKGQTEDMLAQATLIYRSDPLRLDCRDLVVGEYETAKNWKGLSVVASDWTKWHPNDPDNWRFLALAQKNTGEDAQSAESLLKVAELEKNKAPSWLAAADALDKSGDKGAAKLAYEKVMELEPNNEQAEAALLRMAIEGINKPK